MNKSFVLAEGQTARFAISVAAAAESAADAAASDSAALSASWAGAALVRGEKLAMSADADGLSVPAMPPGVWPFEIRIGGYTALAGVFEVLPSPLADAEGSASWALEWSGAEVADIRLVWNGALSAAARCLLLVFPSHAVSAADMASLVDAAELSPAPAVFALPAVSGAASAFLFAGLSALPDALLSALRSYCADSLGVDASGLDAAFATYPL